MNISKYIINRMQGLTGESLSTRNSSKAAEVTFEWRAGRGENVHNHLVSPSSWFERNSTTCSEKKKERNSRVVVDIHWLNRIAQMDSYWRSWRGRGRGNFCGGYDNYYNPQVQNNFGEFDPYYDDDGQEYYDDYHDEDPIRPSIWRILRSMDSPKSALPLHHKRPSLWVLQVSTIRGTASSRWGSQSIYCDFNVVVKTVSHF